MPQRNSTESLLEDLNEKIDTLIRVVGIQVGVGKSTTERARLLKLAGLDNRTISEILNTSPGTVSVLTANLRSRRREM
jgi:hypothetical protein